METIDNIEEIKQSHPEWTGTPDLEKYRIEGRLAARNRSLARAKESRASINLSKTAGAAEFKSLNMVELAQIARIELFEETNVGFDMNLWFNEISRRVESNELSPQNCKLSVFDVSVILRMMRTT